MTARHPERSFQTYRESTATWEEQQDDLPALNARLERERAVRYLDQARTALRLAHEALVRAEGHSARSRQRDGAERWMVGSGDRPPTLDGPTRAGYHEHAPAGGSAEQERDGD